MPSASASQAARRTPAIPVVEAPEDLDRDPAAREVPEPTEATRVRDPVAPAQARVREDPAPAALHIARAAVAEAAVVAVAAAAPEARCPGHPAATGPAPPQAPAEVVHITAPPLGHPARAPVRVARALPARVHITARAAAELPAADPMGQVARGPVLVQDHITAQAQAGRPEVVHPGLAAPARLRPIIRAPAATVVPDIIQPR